MPVPQYDCQERVSDNRALSRVYRSGDCILSTLVRRDVPVHYRGATHEYLSIDAGRNQLIANYGVQDCRTHMATIDAAAVRMALVAVPGTLAASS